MSFNIKADSIIDFTLGLQRINDIALSVAVQNTLNSVVRDTKKRTLNISTNKEFDVKKKSFFKANSGFKTYNAKQHGYKINNLVAYVGVTKGKNSKETATEQVGNQQTAKRIKRSVNPLGEKPKSKSVIDVLSKKPVVYDSSKSYPEGNSIAYIRKSQKALRNKRGLLVTNGNMGALNKVRSIKKLKKPNKDGRKMLINLKPIASYIKSGHVKLKTRRPFLNNAVIQSSKELMEQVFVKEAEKQFEKALKRR